MTQYLRGAILALSLIIAAALSMGAGTVPPSAPFGSDPGPSAGGTSGSVSGACPFNVTLPDGGSVLAAACAGGVTYKDASGTTIAALGATGYFSSAKGTSSLATSAGAGAPVVVSSSSPPTAGQTLVATSATSAAWTTPSAGCRTITDCDFTTQPSQTFASSGTVTLCGYATTSYVNSANAYQASEVSDAGLRLYPNPSTTFDPGTATFDPPLFRIPLAALGVAPVNRIKVWIRATVSAGGASDTSIWFGPEAPSLRFGSYAYFGKVSGLNSAGVVDYITGASTIPSAVNYVAEDVFFLNVNGLWDQILSGGLGTWSGGWPSEAVLTPTGGAYPALTTRSGGNLITQANGDVVLTIANYSGVGPVIGTFKNLRIDVCN